MMLRSTLFAIMVTGFISKGVSGDRITGTEKCNLYMVFQKEYPIFIVYMAIILRTTNEINLSLHI